MAEAAVVTGMGVLSSIGSGYAAFVEGLQTGTDGIREITAFDASELPGHIGGEILDLDDADHFAPAQFRRMDRSTRLTLIALREAVQQAGLEVAEAERLRAGVYMGSTLGGMINGTQYYETLRETGHVNTQPLRDYPLFSSATHIAQALGIEGPNMTFSTACSSANVAIGYGAMMIAAGKLDLAIVGGVDPMAKMTMAGFNCLRNVTTEKIRPFDKNRSGRGGGHSGAGIAGARAGAGGGDFGQGHGVRGKRRRLSHDRARYLGPGGASGDAAGAERGGAHRGGSGLCERARDRHQA